MMNCRWSVGDNYKSIFFLDLSISSFQRYLPKDTNYFIYYNGNDFFDFFQQIYKITTFDKDCVTIVDQKTIINPFNFKPSCFWWKWIPLESNALYIDADILMLKHCKTLTQWNSDLLVTEDLPGPNLNDTIGHFTKFVRRKTDFINAGLIGVNSQEFIDKFKHFANLLQDSHKLNEQGAINYTFDHFKYLKYNTIPESKCTFAHSLEQKQNIDTFKLIHFSLEYKIKMLKYYSFLKFYIANLEIDLTQEISNLLSLNIQEGSKYCRSLLNKYNIKYSNRPTEDVANA